MRRALWAAGLSLLLLGCDQAKPTTPHATTAAPPKPAPKWVARKAEPKPTEAVEPAHPRTFEDAWAEALREKKALDEREPAETEAALKLLTAPERGEIEVIKPFWRLPDEQARLLALGMRPWVLRQSRAEAAGDADFRAVARLAWQRLPSRPGLIVRMMNEWGTLSAFWRIGAVNAIKADTPAANLPEKTRDAILRLVGPEWFTARP